MLGYQFIPNTTINNLKLSNGVLKSRLDAIEKALVKINKNQWQEAIENISGSDASPVIKNLKQLTSSLEKFSTDERARAWLNQGILEIGKIISSHADNFQKLCAGLIRALVNHAKGNQGALFVLGEQEHSPCLIMTARYAYQKNDALNNTIGIGEGLVGQCFREGETINVKDIPKNYIKITSGLGEALPRNLVLIPIKSDGKKIGVIELAFFEEVSPSTLKYVEAASELISRAVHNQKKHQETVELLAKTQDMAQALQEKENKNIETIKKMQAMQEDLTRKNDALERATQELEIVRLRETEMIESKLSVQQIIHDKIVAQLKSKIESLTKQVEKLQNQTVVVTT